jgi:hypothetical protein
MPRPKPPMPLIGRQVRMSDLEWMMLQDLGGADWLRKVVKTKAKFPLSYYMLKLKEKDDSTRR